MTGLSTLMLASLNKCTSMAEMDAECRNSIRELIHTYETCTRRVMQHIYSRVADYYWLNTQRCSFHRRNNPTDLIVLFFTFNFLSG